MLYCFHEILRGLFHFGPFQTRIICQPKWVLFFYFGIQFYNVKSAVLSSKNDWNCICKQFGTCYSFYKCPTRKNFVNRRPFTANLRPNFCLCDFLRPPSLTESTNIPKITVDSEQTQHNQCPSCVCRSHTCLLLGQQSENNFLFIVS